MSEYVVYAAVVVGALAFHALWNAFSRRHAQTSKATLDDVAALGDDLVPASLHPRIDPYLCMGSGSCVNACPEHDVIGLVSGRVSLVNPLACVGHGACATACPVDAIELVFGTAKRGIELPVVDETFQTNQPGIYIAGELGGMGLIRNAITQGREAAEYIASSQRRGSGDTLDAVVIGAGPAGTAATLQMMKDGLRVLLLERDSYGGTIKHYPRRKIVMTGSLELPLYGTVKKRVMSKEALEELWADIKHKTNLPMHLGHLVEKIEAGPGDSWVVHGQEQVFRAANVVLALGRRGSPRKIGVAGEDMDKVTYRLLEPEYFDSKEVLIVGGGNAAAECAIALAESKLCKSVGISYRRKEFARLRGKVRERLQQFIADQQITAYLGTNVAEITADEVKLRDDAGAITNITNGAVVVQIGGTPPTALLESFGIQMVSKFGER